MKNFNKQIQITVELDYIAQLLHHSMAEDFKHRDIVTEAIIGRLDSRNDTQGMTALYNSLHGYTNEINFKEGDIVKCSERAWGYWTQESIDKEDTVQQAIGEAKIISIDLYADKKLTIEYKEPQKDGTFRTKSINVSHLTCELLVSKLDENTIDSIATL